jgi:hypothetical protein
VSGLVFNQWMPIAACGATPMSGPAGPLGFQMELLPITTVNTLPAFSQIPSGDMIILIVNGVTFAPPDGSFSVLGNQATWNTRIYALNPGATVVAIYTYLTG